MSKCLSVWEMASGQHGVGNMSSVPGLLAHLDLTPPTQSLTSTPARPRGAREEPT